MEPTQELVDAIYLEKIERARKTDPTEKLWSGGQLFADACTRMKAGIRHRFPEFNEEEVHRKLLEQLETIRKLHPKSPQ